jgi:taurine dioxygenase
VLYANPGYTVRINELRNDESEALLATIFSHQVRPEFIHTHKWQENDLLVWDNIRTIHNAMADYAEHEHRYMRRCQAKADLVFQSAFRHLVA